MWRKMLLFAGGCLLLMSLLLSGCRREDTPGDEEKAETESLPEEKDDSVVFDMMSEGTPLNGLFTVARVDRINEDGSLVLTRYMRVMGHEDYVIANYANVNFECYGPAKNPLEDYVPEGVAFMRAEKGNLKQASMKDLEEGDMIVSCFPDFHQEVLVIYKEVIEEGQ